ncbi:MAG: TolC family protein [Thermoguttaceae bacterium]
MAPFKWCVCVVMIGAVSNVAMSQQDVAPVANRAAPAPQPSADQTVAPGAMTLAELEEMALSRNPALSQASHYMEAAKGRQLQVGLYPNPTVGYLGSEIGNEGRAGQQGSYVGQEIVTAGKLRLRRDVVAQEVRQAEFTWQSQRQRLLTDVRRSFYDVLVAQRKMELTEQLLRISEEGMHSTESLVQAKEAARADVLQAKIEAESTRVLLERSRNQYASAWRGLAAATGSPNMPPRPLMGEASDNLPHLTWEETCERLLTDSPQIAAAQAGVARAQAAVRREYAQRIPNIDTQMSVQYDNATRNTFATVQAGVPLPLFNRNQGNIRRTEAELLAAQENVERAKLDLQRRLATVFERYTTARYQVEKYSRDILPSAKTSLDLANQGYREGEYNYLFLLTAQRTFFQANLVYLDALRELRSAATAIEGNLLSDSLQEQEAAAAD